MWSTSPSTAPPWPPPTGPTSELTGRPAPPSARTRCFFPATTSRSPSSSSPAFPRDGDRVGWLLRGRRSRQALHERRVFVFQLRVAGGRGVEDEEVDRAVALERRDLALALGLALALAELLALAAGEQRRQRLELGLREHVERAFEDRRLRFLVLWVVHD